MAGYRGSKIAPKRFERDQIKIYVFIIPLAIFMLFPIVFIFSHAFKPMTELFEFPPKFYVKNPVLDNFTNLMKSSNNAGIPLSKYVFNSVFVTVTVIVVNVFISTMAGFALSKMRFKVKVAMLEINNMALMFVATAVMIPTYLVINTIGVTNTYWAHILPLLVMPVTVFLIKQFIDGVPDSLIEAAVVDGATPFRVYLKIILPMVKPAIATCIILTFQRVWTYMDSSNLYISSDSMKLLSFYMNTLANANNAVQGQGVAAASSLIMFIPNLIVFIVTQKNVMNTMAHSGIK